VAQPDFVALSWGQIVVIDPKTEGLTRMDPLQVVAIEEPPPENPKPTEKRSR
jgi:hypothetical protein